MALNRVFPCAQVKGKEPCKDKSLLCLSLVQQMERDHRELVPHSIREDGPSPGAIMVLVGGLETHRYIRTKSQL